jgi:hypothetical protein
MLQAQVLWLVPSLVPATGRENKTRATKEQHPENQKKLLCSLARG